MPPPSVHPTALEGGAARSLESAVPIPQGALHRLARAHPRLFTPTMRFRQHQDRARDTTRQLLWLFVLTVVLTR